MDHKFNPCRGDTLCRERDRYVEARAIKRVNATILVTILFATTGIVILGLNVMVQISHVSDSSCTLQRPFRWSYG